MREKRAWILPSLYLLLLSSTAVLSYFFSIADKGAAWRAIQGAEIGVILFLFAAYAQMAILLFIAPVFGASGITTEKEQRTLAGLLTTLLTPFQIWWGKFVAALLFQVVLLLGALPILALAFSFAGIGPREVSIAIGTTFIILASITSVGLYCSSYFRRTVHATAVTYTIVIGLTLLTTIIFFLLSSGRKNTIEVPMLINPFYTLSAGLFSQLDRFDSWLISIILFIGLGSLAAVLAIRNIKQSSEHL